MQLRGFPRANSPNFAIHLTVQTFAVLICSSLMLASEAGAQATLGQLLDKGGKKITKEEYAALVPVRVQFVWPRGGGEADLVYLADGTLRGTEFHYLSKSESVAVGTWTVDDAGKWCTKKSLVTWDTKSDMCWYSFRLGDDYFSASSDSDRASKVFKVKSLQKQ